MIGPRITVSVVYLQESCSQFSNHWWVNPDTLLHDRCKATNERKKVSMQFILSNVKKKSEPLNNLECYAVNPTMQWLLHVWLMHRWTLWVFTLHGLSRLSNVSTASAQVNVVTDTCQLAARHRIGPRQSAWWSALPPWCWWCGSSGVETSGCRPGTGTPASWTPAGGTLAPAQKRRKNDLSMSIKHSDEEAGQNLWKNLLTKASFIFFLLQLLILQTPLLQRASFLISVSVKKD